MLSDGVWTHTWDYNNRLIQSTSATDNIVYAYDHTGQRVILDDGQSITNYANRYYNENNSKTTKHIYAGDQLIATIEDDGETVNTYYLHADHLGGSSVISDANGDVVQVLDYYPFGDLRIDEKYGGFDEQRKFTGHEYDEDTDLSYMGARYYPGKVGRFLSQDLMIRAIGGDMSGFEKKLGELLINPQSLNSYSYVINNPIRYNDPTGETYAEATGGYFVGMGQSLWGTVKGIANSVAHPINTVKGIGNSIVNAGNEWKQFTSDITSDPSGTISQISEGAQIGYNEFMNKSDYEKGKIIGGITEKVMEVATVKKASEGMTKIGSKQGLQMGKYNVKLDTYNKAGGGGLNLRDTTLSNNPYNQRIFGVDYHKFNNNGVIKPRVHYHVGTGSEGDKHRPYQK